MTPREIAARDGKSVFEGEPCRKCGGTERYTLNGGCRTCIKATSSAKYKTFKALYEQAKAERT